MKHKLFTLLFALMASMTIANAEVYSGTCGAQDDNLTWSLNTEDSVLTISGTGAMAGWVWSSPWYEYQEYITSVTIPNSVTSIGDFAFYQCSNMTSVTIPSSVTSIGDFAFYQCSGLTSMIVENGNPAYDSRDNCNAIIETASNTLIAGCKNTTIPNSITSIGGDAFYQCYGLTSITIPNSVTSIGWGAFEVCLSLTSVTIGNSVASIGSYAFFSCYNLTSVTIPNSVTDIGEQAFYGCYGLTSITSEAVTPPTCGNEVFVNVPKSIPLYVPAKSVTAYQSANGWSDFTNIQAIPGTEPCIIASGYCGVQGDNLTWELSCDSVLTISGTGEMFDCSSSESIPWNTYASSITSILLEEGITYICNYAFHSCVALTSLTIPRSVTNLGYGLFYNCNNLVDISVDNENLNYSSLDGVLFNKNQTTLVEYPKGREGAYIVPNTVISIGERAFEMCYGLTSIIIPYGTTTIEENAFYLCKNLTSVELPKSITTIRTYAFTECHKLPSIAIPESAIEISTDAFRMCENMVSIDVDANNPLYASEDGVLFNKNKTRLIVCPGGKRGTYVIPESVTSIEVNAFNACKRLSNIEASNNIVSIEKWAFWACDSLMSFTIPIQVTTIGDCTFQNCSTLMSVVIPENVINIGNYVFSNCVSLAEIYNYSLIPQTINNNVFSGVSKSACSLYVPAQSVAAYQSADGWKEFTNILPICPIASGTCGAEGDSTNLVWELSCDSVLTISGTGAMADYNSSATPWSGHYSEITSVVINEGVTNIGNRTFSGLMSLTSIEIPNSVTSIGNYAFCQCRSLTSIEIPDGVTSIGEYAFFECYSLTSMIIPDSVTSIGVAAFSKCSGLTSVTIPNRITSIGNYVFSNCTGLTHIEIPNSVTSIGNDAFTHCSGLTHIEIPSSVVSIGNEVFSSCSSLTSVEIPNSVTSIGNDAFWGCGSLISITNNATIPHVLNASAFGGSDFSPAVDKTTCILYVPYESVNAYKAADVWKEFTNIQPIKCLIASGTCGAQGDNLTWELSCDSVLTISGTGAMANYSLGGPWAEYRWIIKSIVFSDDLTTIGARAFYECEKITSINIPNNVTSIGYGAFQGCFNLQGITIPQNVTSIGTYAFLACSGLTSIVVDAANTVYDSRDNCNAIVETATNTLLFGCTNTSFLSSITSIADYAVSHSYKTYLNIPNTITSIGMRAFDANRNLYTVNFGNGLTSIGEHAFRDCQKLTTINIPESVTQLGDNPFWICTKVTSITVNENNTYFDSRNNCNAIIETASNKLISGCVNTIIPEDVTTIGAFAFSYVDFTSIIIPQNVTVLEQHAFSYCEKLTRIDFMSSIPPTIGMSCFDNVTATFYVPCGTKDAYVAALGVDESRVHEKLTLAYSVVSDDNTKGSVTMLQEPSSCEDLTLSFRADAAEGYQFSRWSDGNTDNPRSLILSQDTSLVAEFEIVPCYGYPVATTAPAVTACDSYYWAEADTTIAATGTYAHTFATAAGCDSIVTLDVTIHRSEHGSDTLFIVQKDTIRFDINDEEMDSLFSQDSKKFIVLDTLSTIFGCDSIVHHFMYEIIKDTSIVIPQDSALNFDDLTTDTITQIVIEPQGEVTVNILDIRVGDVIITSDGMHSGQVHGGDNLHAQHIYMEYILNPWGLYASPDRWYAFAVPFDVDIATGISRTCDNKTLVSGTDFLILEYKGLLRALQGKGWSKKLTGTLEPGNFYMLGIDGNCNHWRFEKMENKPVQGNNSQSFNANGAGNPNYSPQNTGWNGMGNTQLEYSSMDLSGYDMEYLVTYDNQHGKYVTRRIDEIDLFVGQPFFIQAPGDGHFDFHNNSHPHPMPALRTQKAANPYLHFTLTNESGNVGTDHLYLSLHDDVTGTYTIGRDITRMSSSCTTAAQLWCTANGIQLNAHGIALPTSETTVNISLYAPANGEYLLEMNARAMEEFDIELLYHGTHMTTFFVGQPVTLNLNAGTTNDYSLRISRKSPTNFGNVPTDKAQSTKVLIDNNLYILQGGHIYDAQGKKVK